MASSTPRLTLEQYHERYSSQAGYEFWFGEARRKPAPTWLHSILQGLMGEQLNRAEYTSGSELELRIDADWEPRPDVAAALHVVQPYPTRPVDIVAEILSPDDGMSEVHTKCEHYARIGIAQIFVFDPERKRAWEWDRSRGNLERVDVLELYNGQRIHLDSDVWPEMQRRASRT